MPGMEKAFRSRYVIGKPVRYHSRRGFFLYQETQHCGWEKQISAYAAIIYRRDCLIPASVYRLEKDMGLYRKRPWTGQHTILEPMQHRQPQSVFLYQADNFSAGKNKHRRMPPVTRESQGLHIFHRARTSPVHLAADAANPAAGRNRYPSWILSHI